MSTKNRIIAGIIFIIHLVGAIGTIYPETRSLVVQLTPLNLIISVSLVLLGHPGGWLKLIGFFFTSFTIGLLVEILGVQTGFPFGDYWYGDTLGVKIAGVPIIIGLNWFMLSYLFGMLYNFFKISNILKIFLAAASMVILDLLIEPVAIKLDYWHWNDQNIPLSNYLGWFVIAILIQFCFKKLNIYQTNQLIIPLLLAQIAYFALIFIFL